MPTRASDLQVDPVGRMMLIGCGAALFGLRLAVRFTAGRGPSIRSMRTSVPESVPAGFVICGNMSMPEELIPADRCWELLATVSVGRLALSVRALPVILPVQYYLDGRRLAVCLGHHQLPDRALNDVIIAFAADAIDPVDPVGLVGSGSGPVGDPAAARRGYRLRPAGSWADRADRAGDNQRPSYAPVPVHRGSPDNCPGGPHVVTCVSWCRTTGPAGTRVHPGTSPCRYLDGVEPMSSAMAWQQPGPSARQIGQSAHGLAAGRTGTCGSWTLAETH